jgi:fatty-acyl-CoA synthase
MEIPLSPLEFARRARKLYANREAVVDQNLRFTYEQFFDRCDRWSSALQGFGIRKGDRVAYIAPNTHAQLESFYAIPQVGAVLVPVNYRLIADDFLYLINHSGARIVCAHSDYLDAVDSIRAGLSNVEQFVALEGSKPEWLEYEKLIAGSSPQFQPPEIEETDLITINYTSGTTARPKGVMITHRVHECCWHTDSLSDDAGRALFVDFADVSRKRLDICMDQHSGGSHPHSEGFVSGRTNRRSRSGVAT